MSEARDHPSESNEAALNLYFHCPKKISRPLEGRHSRKGETAGLEMSSTVRLCGRPEEADLLWPRLVPERTRADDLEEAVRFCSDLPSARILNHPANLWLSDSKDRAFAAWENAGLPVPRHTVLESSADLLHFVSMHPAALVRLNNAASADHTVVLRGPSAREVDRAFDKVKAAAARHRRRGRSDTRPIAVELLDSRAGDDLVASYRTFVAAGRIVGGYALISDRPAVNLGTSVCSSDREEELFLAVNTRLDFLLAEQGFNELAAAATAVLGLDICCLDFVLVDDAPCLLEANALWGPASGWAGGKHGRMRWARNPDLWREKAGNYCVWMDRPRFYRDFFEEFRRFSDA